MPSVYKNVIKVSYVFLCAVFVFQSLGCGTLLYPERRGQRGGHIDAGVAVLDGVGLLLFIIPGVIAYAVDFSNGTIYLPGTARTSLDVKKIKQVKFNPSNRSLASVEKIIKEQTGLETSQLHAGMKVIKLSSIQDMLVQFALIMPEVQNSRLSLSR